LSPGSPLLLRRGQKPRFVFVPFGTECHKGKGDLGDKGISGTSQGARSPAALSSARLGAFLSLQRTPKVAPDPSPAVARGLRVGSTPPPVPAPPTRNQLGSLWISSMNLITAPGGNKQAKTGVTSPGM